MEEKTNQDIKREKNGKPTRDKEGNQQKELTEQYKWRE